MHWCRRFVVCTALALVTATVGGPSLASAQEPKPVAMVSVAPLDRLLKDVAFLLRSANFPEIGGVVRVMADQYTQGIDKSRPWGITIHMDGEMPVGVLFLPMSDREQFFGALGSMGIEPDDLGDGLYEIDANGQILYAKEANGWMFVAQAEDMLSSVPNDPAAALGELPNKYDVAIRANIQSLPEDMRAMAAEQMRMGFERTLAEQSPEDQAAAREMGEVQMAQLEQLMNETEQVIFGWAIEPGNQKTYLDTAAQFVAGSKLAAQMEEAKSLTSAFVDFVLPNPSAVFRATSEVNEQADKDVMKMSMENSFAQANSQFDQQGLEGEARELVDGLFTTLKDIMMKTVDEGKFDGVASLSVADDTLRVLVGGQLADGKALEQELKDLIAGLPDNDKKPVAEFDYATFEGVTLHKLTVPSNSSDPVVNKIFGENLTFFIGTANKGFMLALDPTGDALLKAAIQKMKSSGPGSVQPLKGVVELSSILQYAQSVSPNSMLDLAVDAASQYSGKDKIQLDASVIPRGMIYRFTIEEGVLRAIGTVAKAGGGAGGGF